MQSRGAAAIRQTEAQANAQRIGEEERRVAAAQVIPGGFTSATDQQVDLSTLDLLAADFDELLVS